MEAHPVIENGRGGSGLQGASHMNCDTLCQEWNIISAQIQNKQHVETQTNKMWYQLSELDQITANSLREVHEISDVGQDGVIN